MEVSLTAWFIQKGPGRMAGRLDQELFSRTWSCHFDTVLKNSVCLMVAPSLVCLALAWMPPGKAIPWAWITAPRPHFTWKPTEGVLSRSHSNSVARLTLGAPSMRGHKLPPDLQAAPQTQVTTQAGLPSPLQVPPTHLNTCSLNPVSSRSAIPESVLCFNSLPLRVSGFSLHLTLPGAHPLRTGAGAEAPSSLSISAQACGCQGVPWIQPTSLPQGGFPYLPEVAESLSWDHPPGPVLHRTQPTPRRTASPPRPRLSRRWERGGEDHSLAAHTGQGVGQGRDPALRANG